MDWIRRRTDPPLIITWRRQDFLFLFWIRFFLFVFRESSQTPFCSVREGGMKSTTSRLGGGVATRRSVADKDPR